MTEFLYGWLINLRHTNFARNPLVFLILQIKFCTQNPPVLSNIKIFNHPPSSSFPTPYPFALYANIASSQFHKHNEDVCTNTRSQIDRPGAGGHPLGAGSDVVALEIQAGGGSVYRTMYWWRNAKSTNGIRAVTRPTRCNFILAMQLFKKNF